jgi:uncharacterized DUF497 family protein
LDFEWDETKRRGNLAVHGVDFEDAALIFAGPIVEAEDCREAYGERRFRALGAVEGEFFLVAYTWRGTVRRIISAWRVDDDGRRRYAAILAG